MVLEFFQGIDNSAAGGMTPAQVDQKALEAFKDSSKVKKEQILKNEETKLNTFNYFRSLNGAIPHIITGNDGRIFRDKDSVLLAENMAQFRAFSKEYNSFVDKNSKNTTLDTNYAALAQEFYKTTNNGADIKVFTGKDKRIYSRKDGSLVGKNDKEFSDFMVTLNKGEDIGANVENTFSTSENQDAFKAMNRTNFAAQAEMLLEKDYIGFDADNGWYLTIKALDETKKDFSKNAYGSIWNHWNNLNNAVTTVNALLNPAVNQNPRNQEGTKEYFKNNEVNSFIAANYVTANKSWEKISNQEKDKMNAATEIFVMNYLNQNKLGNSINANPDVIEPNTKFYLSGTHLGEQLEGFVGKIGKNLGFDKLEEPEAKIVYQEDPFTLEMFNTYKMLNRFWRENSARKDDVIKKLKKQVFSVGANAVYANGAKDIGATVMGLYETQSGFVLGAQANVTGETNMSSKNSVLNYTGQEVDGEVDKSITEVNKKLNITGYGDALIGFRSPLGISYIGAGVEEHENVESTKAKKWFESANSGNRTSPIQIDPSVSYTNKELAIPFTIGHNVDLYGPVALSMQAKLVNKAQPRFGAGLTYKLGKK